MRSTTGKKIRFTLQRTPIWAWAGPIIEPVSIFGIDWSEKDSFGTMVEVQWWRNNVMQVLSITPLTARPRSSNRETAHVTPRRFL